MRKKIFFSLVVLMLLAGCIEGISYIAYVAANHKPFSFATVKKNAHEVISASQTQLGQGTQKDYLIDPYCGYVGKIPQPAGGSLKTLNLARSYGFDTNGQLIPDYPEMVFTVAILGGSVAKYFAANMSEVLKQYIERLPQAKGKEIVILGLGNYSYKEPQQLNIVNDFIAQGARFDIVVNIDGFNEVAHPGVHNIPNNVSPFYPSGWSDRTGEVSSNEDLALLGKTTILKDLRAKIARAYEKFGHGVTAGTIWSFCDMLLAKRIYALETSRLTKQVAKKVETENFQSVSPSGKISYGSHRSYPPDELYPDLASHWAISSAIINNIVTSAGGKYYHFLQPNQYDTGSKVMNEEEKKIAIGDSPYRAGVELGYGLLRKAGRSLAACGVNFTDTSSLFLNHTETLYMDDCCHYNKDGEEILARKIGETILSAENGVSKEASIRKLYDELDASVENTGKINRLANLHCDLVASNKDSEVPTKGLWDAEQDNEHRFRWGIGPQSSITLWAPKHSSIRLSAQFLSATPGQVVTVSANGAVLDHWQDIEYTRTATQFSEKSLTFPARPGRNVIELQYKNWLGDGKFDTVAKDPRPFAVMFRTLTVETVPDVDRSDLSVGR